MTLIWDDFFKRQKKRGQSIEYLPHIYPLVFYHGRQTPYPYSMNFLAHFQDQEFAPKLYYRDFKLIDVSQISDDELELHGLAAPFELIQKHILQRDFSNYIKELL